MALGRQVVDFVRSDNIDDANQGRGVRQIPLVQGKVLRSHQMLDAGRVRQRSPADDAMYLIALLEQKLRQIRAVLSCNSGNQRYFVHSFRSFFAVFQRQSHALSEPSPLLCPEVFRACPCNACSLTCLLPTGGLFACRPGRTALAIPHADPPERH